MGGRSAADRRGLGSHRWLWLIICIVVLGSCGCGVTPFDLGIDAMFVPASPVQPTETRPTKLEPKPAEAEDAFDPRHPHRWRRKLRAKYA